MENILDKQKIGKKKVSLFWNGFSYQIFYPVSEWFLKHNYEVFIIENPFNPKDNKKRLFSLFTGTSNKRVYRSKRSLVKVPFSYFFDIFWPVNHLRSNITVSFSPHLSFRNIILKKLGFVDFTIHWNIDYSPIRFKNFILQNVYVWLDKFSLKYSDVQIDLTSVAQEARLLRYNLKKTSKNLVIPVGANFKGLPKYDLISKLNLVFVGNFNETQDVELLLKCMDHPKIKNLKVVLHIIGSGAKFNYFKKNYKNPKIIFYGNLNQEEIDSILSQSHIGLAPYINDPLSFSKYSDPSKLKKYSEFGLPIVMSNVPHNSKFLFDAGIAFVGPCSVDFFAHSISELQKNVILLKIMSLKSKDYCLSYSWDKVLEPVFRILIKNDLIKDQD